MTKGQGKGTDNILHSDHVQAILISAWGKPLDILNLWFLCELSQYHTSQTSLLNIKGAREGAILGNPEVHG